jgi:hypothetical protein
VLTPYEWELPDGTRHRVKSPERGAAAERAHAGSQG